MKMYCMPHFHKRRISANFVLIFFFKKHASIKTKAQKLSQLGGKSQTDFRDLGNHLECHSSDLLRKR